MKRSTATQSQKAVILFFNILNQQMVRKNLNNSFISVKDILSEEIIQMEQVPLLRWQTVWEKYSSANFPPGADLTWSEEINQVVRIPSIMRPIDWLNDLVENLSVEYLVRTFVSMSMKSIRGTYFKLCTVLAVWRLKGALDLQDQQNSSAQGFCFPELFFIKPEPLFQ